MFFILFVFVSPPLLLNLKHRLLNQPLEDWIPQLLFLGIIMTGNEYAIASKGGYGIEGEFLWKLKDKIDRTFMQNFQILPDIELMMKERQLNQNKSNNENIISEVIQANGNETIDILNKSFMRCGGCGSKIGSQLLTRILNKINLLYSFTRKEVISGPGEDAALMLPPNENQYSVHTIDYFKQFISDPFITGQIAANHALSGKFCLLL